METNHRVFKLVDRMLKQSADANQKAYNIRFSTRDSNIKVGDRVYVKRMQKTSKLESSFVGPFRVMERNADSIVIKNLFNHQTNKVHLSHVILVRQDDVENVAKHGISHTNYPDVAYTLE